MYTVSEPHTVHILAECDHVDSRMLCPLRIVDDINRQRTDRTIAIRDTYSVPSHTDICFSRVLTLHKTPTITHYGLHGLSRLALHLRVTI